MVLRPPSLPPPPLGPLRAEVLADREPPGGLGQRVGLRRVHPRQRRGELRPQGVVDVAAGAAEAEELRDDLGPRLGGVQVQVLEGRTVDLVEAVVDRHLPPRAFDVPADGQVMRVEITRALGGLESAAGSGHRSRVYPTCRTPAPLIASCLSAMSASLASASGNVRMWVRTPTRAASSRKSLPSSRVLLATLHTTRSQ